MDWPVPIRAELLRDAYVIATPDVHERAFRDERVELMSVWIHDSSL
jgi:hypothetical protein